MWCVFDPDSAYCGTAPGGFMINYRVDDLPGLLAQLRAAGVEPPLDRALARDIRIDLHAVISLIEHGCPPAVALRRLLPA